MGFFQFGKTGLDHFTQNVEQKLMSFLDPRS
jgi:hypothetical protein